MVKILYIGFLLLVNDLLRLQIANALFSNP